VSPSLLLTDIGQLVTCTGTAGSGEASLAVSHNTSVLIHDGLIAGIGPDDDAVKNALASGVETLSMDNQVVMPGFVDSHTHIVFGGDRVAEFNARMSGAPYIAGGIGNTVSATREASRDALVSNASDLRDEMLLSGSTTVEIKSGYGLTVEHEKRLLEVARGITDQTTFFGGPSNSRRARGQSRELCRCGVRTHVGALRTVRPVCGCLPRKGGVRFAAGATGTYGRRYPGVNPDPPCQPIRARRGGKNRRRGGSGLALPRKSPHNIGYTTSPWKWRCGDSTARHRFFHRGELSRCSPFLRGRNHRISSQQLQSWVKFYLLDVVYYCSRCARNVDVACGRCVAATAGGAAALRLGDRGQIRVGARADMIQLAAPTYAYVAYRPGVDLVRRVFLHGELVVEKFRDVR